VHIRDDDGGGTLLRRTLELPQRDLRAFALGDVVDHGEGARLSPQCDEPCGDEDGKSHPVADARRRPGGFVAGMQALISPVALEDELLQFTLHAGDRIRSSLGGRQGVQPGALRDAVRNELEDFTGSASACMIHETTTGLRRIVEEIVRSSRLDHSFPR